ncbi:hypothetical protein TNCV_2713041 [Trichonephila clavipes]|nr:hypothetical protein TNCV_2713041 [Trichonephila clavipes]
MVRKKKRASNPRKNIALTAKEIESSSSLTRFQKVILQKMETMNEIKIKQEENVDADEEKLQQPITIFKNDIRFEDLQTFSQKYNLEIPSKHSLEILKRPTLYPRNQRFPQRPTVLRPNAPTFYPVKEHKTIIRYSNLIKHENL